MPYKLLQTLLANLLEIPVVRWDDDFSLCEQLEHTHCFSPTVQTQLHADALDLFCHALRDHCLYELQDRLGLRLVLFRIDGQVILVGPFVAEGWNSDTARSTLAKNGLPATRLVPYQLYYCSYRVLTAADVLHCIRAVADALTEDKTPYRHQLILGPQEKDVMHSGDTAPDFTTVMRRYDAENEMIRCLQKGDASGVTAARKQASMVSMDSNLRYIMANDALTGVSVTRTLMRKAAEGAGVHPVVVDAISREYEQRGNACRNLTQFDKLLQNMTEAYCAAVRTVQKEQYSPVVRYAVDYIRLNLSAPLRLNQIAAVAKVSTTHLGRLFKAETGVTVIQYIAEQRCHQAASLLRTTTLTVQEISSYVGYLDNNYFVKVFRAQYHMTPTEYRHHMPLHHI